MDNNSPSWTAALLRGTSNRCPACGGGKLLQGYLKPYARCSNCALDFTPLKADDGPAYVTLGLVCLFVVPFFFVGQALFDPSPALALLVSLPLTTLITCLLLRPVKGAFMAAEWKSHAP